MTKAQDLPSLTAELEKMEQNITLTLQEIDRNLSSCYDTVTNNLLPRIDQFGDISKQILDDAKPWLQFFELVNEFENISEKIENTFESPSVKTSPGNRIFESPTPDTRHTPEYENSPAYPVLQSQHTLTPGRKPDMPKMNTPLLQQVFAKTPQTQTVPRSVRSVRFTHDTKFGDENFREVSTPSSIKKGVLKTPTTAATGQSSAGPTPRSIRSILLASRASSERKPAVQSAALPSRMREIKFESESPENSPTPTDTPFSSVDDNLTFNALSPPPTPQSNNFSSHSCPSTGVQSHRSYNSNSSMEEPKLKTPFAKFYSDAGSNSTDIDTPTLFTKNLDRMSVDDLLDSDRSSISAPNSKMFDDNSPCPQLRLFHRYSNDEDTETTTDEEKSPEFKLDLFPKAFQEPPGSDQLASLYDQFRLAPEKVLGMDDLQAALPDFGGERINLLINLLVRRKFVTRSSKSDGWSMRK
ncbi:hypothetical protein K493DRAFT_404126 [Basidiobolus meristosporus CBS 931.73]|uniref:DASH complex subunit ASK1 n=1 Tax=Basidiobolus meristosporus CBS 931.73 TaxID=1314790 RepID=A0A1Y1Z754_9FUNG|nr:hypothetical protein K493DRAFT_404126 [Basidiobolus meristosporus CBS 931.73]|eukprot:ORY06081.1 hypothetical protein K493DRAFT_404126 [Basidiobolus meristosporus CBS 931.73]